MGVPPLPGLAWALTTTVADPVKRVPGLGLGLVLMYCGRSGSRTR